MTFATHTIIHAVDHTVGLNFCGRYLTYIVIIYRSIHFVVGCYPCKNSVFFVHKCVSFVTRGLRKTGMRRTICGFFALEGRPRKSPGFCHHKKMPAIRYINQIGAPLVHTLFPSQLIVDTELRSIWEHAKTDQSMRF